MSYSTFKLGFGLYPMNVSHQWNCLQSLLLSSAVSSLQGDKNPTKRETSKAMGMNRSASGGQADEARLFGCEGHKFQSGNCRSTSSALQPSVGGFPFPGEWCTLLLNYKVIEKIVDKRKQRFGVEILCYLHPLLFPDEISESLDEVSWSMSALGTLSRPLIQLTTNVWTAKSDHQLS